MNSRTYVVVASLVAAGIIVGCGDLDNPSRPTKADSDGSNAASASSNAKSPDATFPVAPELAAVRAATAKFHDVSSAYAAGYTTQFEPCVENPGVGVMGVHARHETLMGDQLLDPLRPELLLYTPKPNGGLRLTGVEYFQVVLVRNPATNKVEPWRSPDPWPATYEVVTPTPRLFGQTFDGPMPGHIPTMPWHWDLHVWIWAHNPSGTFAEWNPALQCAE
jgi:hypothetical protein